MKYLRPFNEDISNDFYQDVKDICLELQDDGFKLYIRRADRHTPEYRFKRMDSMIVTIHSVMQIRKTTFFKFKEVSESLYRIIEYAGQCGVSYKVELHMVVPTSLTIDITEIFQEKSPRYDERICGSVSIFLEKK